MGINLKEIEKQLLQPQNIIVPVSGNYLTYQSRKFKVENCKDGWYRTVLDNDGVKELERLSALQVIQGTERLKSVIGCIILSGFVFQSFAQEKALTGGMAQQHRVYFTEERTDWDMIRAVHWEDGNLYYCRDYYCRDGKEGLAFVNVLRRYQEREGLDGLRDVTPELRLVYILARLERERVEMQLKAEAEERARAEFLRTLKGRLMTTLQDAGAEYVSHRQQGEDAAVVVWRVAGRQFNSVIRTGGSFRVRELGFCASGHDREHTLRSAVGLVRGYIEEGEYFDVTRS